MSQIRTILEDFEGGKSEESISYTEQAIKDYIAKEKQQLLMNFVAQYKAERVGHALGTKASEWKRELDHLDEFYATQHQRLEKAE